jgi:hypothetical protein
MLLVRNDKIADERLSRGKETDVDFGPFCHFFLLSVVGNRTPGKNHDTYISAGVQRGTIS